MLMMRILWQLPLMTRKCFTFTFVIVICILIVFYLDSCLDLQHTDDEEGDSHQDRGKKNTKLVSKPSMSMKKRRAPTPAVELEDEVYVAFALNFSVGFLLLLQ